MRLLRNQGDASLIVIELAKFTSYAESNAETPVCMSNLLNMRLHFFHILIPLRRRWMMASQNIVVSVGRSSGKVIYYSNELTSSYSNHYRMSGN